VGFHIDALEAVVFGKVVSATKGADDGVLWATAELDGVAKGMAVVALFNQR